jgi:hypothetical protein
MPSVFNLTDATLDWLAVLLPGMVALLAFLFILIRRMLAFPYLRTRDECVERIRQDWEQIVSLQIPPAGWLFNRLKRRIVEETALDLMDIASSDEARALDAFFRASGLLDHYKDAAQHQKGWRRWEAIEKLGRMRAAESFPLVVEALGGHSRKSTFEAVRVLGGIGTPEAGAAIIRYIQNGSDCRPGIAEPALFKCYHGDPCQLARATLSADDAVRPVLARVLAEVAIPGPSRPDGVAGRVSRAPCCWAVAVIAASAAASPPSARASASAASFPELSTAPPWRTVYRPPGPMPGRPPGDHRALDHVGIERRRP